MVGYDISGTALERARQTYPHLQFEQGDILDMLKDPSVKSQPFDFVCAAEVLYYLQAEADRREAIAGLARLGTPNCLYFFSVIVVPGSAQRRYFTYQEFVDLLSGHFCIIDSFACWPRETPAFRALRRLAPTRAARHRFVRTWTKLCRPEAAKHAGYFALKRLVH